MATDTVAIGKLPPPVERVAIVSLLLVFLCGAVLGAVVMSYWIHPNLHPRPGVAGFSMSVREYKEKLNLTDEQTRKLTLLLDDFTRYYTNVLADGNTRIIQLLTPEQKVKYDRMMADHKKE